MFRRTCLQWFDHANLVSSSSGSNMCPNIDEITLVMSIFFFEYEDLKRFVCIDDNILHYKRKMGNRMHFLNWR